MVKTRICQNCKAKVTDVFCIFGPNRSPEARYVCQSCGAYVGNQLSFKLMKQFNIQIGMLPNMQSHTKKKPTPITRMDVCRRVYTMPDKQPKPIRVKERIGDLRADQLFALPYSEYLQTEHWREMARRCKKAAGNRCQLCNSTKSLNAHHRTYVRRGRELLGDLTCLCEKCHKKFHDIETT